MSRLLAILLLLVLAGAQLGAVGLLLESSAADHHVDCASAGDCGPGCVLCPFCRASLPGHAAPAAEPHVLVPLAVAAGPAATPVVQAARREILHIPKPAQA